MPELDRAGMGLLPTELTINVPNITREEFAEILLRVYTGVRRNLATQVSDTE